MEKQKEKCQGTGKNESYRSALGIEFDQSISLPSIQRYYAYTHSSLRCNRYRPDRMLQRVFRFTNDNHGSTTTDEFLFIFNSARVRQRNRACHGDGLFPRYTIPWAIYLLRRTLSATPLSVKLKIGKTESMLTVFSYVLFSSYSYIRLRGRKEKIF